MLPSWLRWLLDAEYRQQVQAEHQAWVRDHDAAWTGAGVPDAAGYSPVMRDCLRALNEVATSHGRTLDYKLTQRWDPLEGENPQLEGNIAGTPIRFWIYLDGAHLQLDEDSIPFEREDARTPAEFRDKFIGRVVALLATSSGAKSA